MPCREVGQVDLDHAGRVLELALSHAGANQVFALEAPDDEAAVAPGVEVATVLGQHLADEAEFLLPDTAR